MKKQIIAILAVFFCILQLANALEVYDDFEDGVINTSLWDTYLSFSGKDPHSNGIFAERNGYLNVETIGRLENIKQSLTSKQGIQVGEKWAISNEIANSEGASERHCYLYLVGQNNETALLLHGYWEEWGDAQDNLGEWLNEIEITITDNSTATIKGMDYSKSVGITSLNPPYRIRYETSISGHPEEGTGHETRLYEISHGVEEQTKEVEEIIEAPKTKEKNYHPKAVNVVTFQSYDGSLECSYDYQDPEGDPQTEALFMWFKEGIIQSQRAQNITWAKEGESWRCGVKVKNEHGISGWSVSEYIIIIGGEKEEPVNNTILETENITFPVLEEIADEEVTENVTEIAVIETVEQEKGFPYIYIASVIPLLAVGIFSVKMWKRRKFELSKKAYFDHLDNQNNQVIEEEQNGKKQPEEAGIEPVKAGAAKQAASD